jgi:hypothetical protein
MEELNMPIPVPAATAALAAGVIVADAEGPQGLNGHNNPDT